MCWWICVKLQLVTWKRAFSRLTCENFKEESIEPVDWPWDPLVIQGQSTDWDRHSCWNGKACFQSIFLQVFSQLTWGQSTDWVNSRLSPSQRSYWIVWGQNQLTDPGWISRLTCWNSWLFALNQLTVCAIFFDFALIVWWVLWWFDELNGSVLFAFLLKVDQWDWFDVVIAIGWTCDCHGFVCVYLLIWWHLDVH